MEEVLAEGTNFRLARREELPDILAFLESYLPDSIKFHQTLRTYLEDFIWEFHFYISKKWPDEPICLHFPGMTSSPNGRTYESFSVFCPPQRLDLLELVEHEDTLLDWSLPLYLNFTHTDIVGRFEKFYENIGSLEKVCGDIYICLQPIEDLPVDKLEPEDGVEIRKLVLEDVPTIHDLYPANDMEAIDVFQILITKLPAYGVFCGGELAAWMVQSYYGAMFSMQTRPEFRRRGYGLHLARRLTQTVRERGYIPFVVIRPENDASKSLYTKLGFTKLFQTVRAIFRPHGYSESSIETTNTTSEVDEKLTQSEVT